MTEHEVSRNLAAGRSNILLVPNNFLSAAILGGLGLLYCIAILHSDRAYIDDLGRSLEGSTADWEANGRQLSAFLLVVLNFGKPIVDLSPLTQIMAIIVVVFTCYVIFLQIDHPELPVPVTVVAASMFMLSPFLLENLSYKFDSLPMSLGMLFAVLASRPTKNGRLWSILVGGILLTSALSLYQPAINVFLAASVLFIVSEVSRRSDNNFILSSIVVPNICKFILGALVYALVGMGNVRYDYPLRHSKTVPLNVDGLSQIIGNYSYSTRTIVNFFSHSQRNILLIWAVVAIVGCAVLAWMALRRDGRGCWQSFSVALIVLISPVLMFSTVLGISAILEEPILAARVYVAFGLNLVLLVFVAAIGLNLLCRVWPKDKFATVKRVGSFLAVSVPLLLCINYAFAFSNAQTAQKQFDIEIMRRIELALGTIGAKPNDTLVIQGEMPLAIRAAVIRGRYPGVEVLVPRYLRDDWWWGHQMLHYYGLSVQRPDDATRDRAIAAAAGREPDYQDPLFAVFRTNWGFVLRFLN